MLKREDRIAQIRDIKRHTSDKDTDIISVILVLERDEFAILSSLCTQNNRLLGLKGPNNSGYERIYETINSTLDLPEYDIVEISQYDEMYFQLMIEMKKKQAAAATETADIHLELEETRKESDQPTGGRKRKSTKRRKYINKRRKSINKRRKSMRKRRKSMRRR
jgi:hypothetical protein